MKARTDGQLHYTEGLYERWKGVSDGQGNKVTVLVRLMPSKDGWLSGKVVTRNGSILGKTSGGVEITFVHLVHASAFKEVARTPMTMIQDLFYGTEKLVQTKPEKR